jgi:hypothetical protein
LTLTDEAVVEPPPGLYAALLRTKNAAGAWRMAVPVYAQSPLPWRVDLVDPARDFRRGMMRRQATFVWTLGRPAEDFGPHSLYVIRVDRNGQTYLPEEVGEFITAEQLS